MLDEEYRNGPLKLPFVERDQYPPLDYDPEEDGPLPLDEAFKLQGGSRGGDTVQLVSGDLLRICKIIQNFETGEWFLRGLYFRPIKSPATKDILPEAVNEVAMEIKLDNDDYRRPSLQSLKTVKLEDVACKCDLVLTNIRGAIETGPAGNDPSFVCRWMTIAKFAYAKARVQANPRPQEQSIRRLREDEADVGYTVTDLQLTEAWLGYLPRLKQKYTYGVAFAGIGGDSVAAVRAGYKIKWSTDHSAEAMETYARNFPNALYWPSEISDLLILMQKENFRVDHLHLSPPCQPYARCNTRPNAEKDFYNQMPIFAIADMVKLVRPRVITIEQTDGITDYDHVEWFRLLLSMLTINDYSVRWKVVPFDAYGNVQKRKRIIIYASCPGGALPDFPEPTHGMLGGPACVTIREALAPLAGRLGRAAENHNPEVLVAKNLRKSKTRAPYSPNTPLRALLHTGGTTQWHPSGLRPFTLREQALLQGFPVDFIFPTEQSDKQHLKGIGNAVPGWAFVPLLEQAIATMQQEDVLRNGD